MDYSFWVISIYQSYVFIKTFTIKNKQIPIFIFFNIDNFAIKIVFYKYCNPTWLGCEIIISPYGAYKIFFLILKCVSWSIHIEYFRLFKKNNNIFTPFPVSHTLYIHKNNSNRIGHSVQLKAQVISIKN